MDETARLKEISNQLRFLATRVGGFAEERSPTMVMPSKHPPGLNHKLKALKAAVDEVQTQIDLIWPTPKGNDTPHWVLGSFCGVSGWQRRHPDGRGRRIARSNG